MISTSSTSSSTTITRTIDGEENDGVEASNIKTSSNAVLVYQQ